MSAGIKTRRDFLKTLGLGAVYVAMPGCGNEVKESTAVAFGTKSGRRPNLLWLISEDTSPDMGCYGVGQVKTPHLDKLAGEGIRFTNAFVTCPVCSPARSAFMTGMYQTSIGAHNHRSHRRDGYKLPEPVEVITEYFRRAGYFTSNCAGLNRKKPGKTDWNFTPTQNPFDGTDWMQRREGQPFFAQVNFGMTHRRFKRDKRSPVAPEKVRIPPYYPDHPVTRRDWADYLESIQILDRQIGTVLSEIEKQGLAEDTIVMYFGDHGRCHVRGKQWLYEGGIRIPLIIRLPERFKESVVIDDLVSSIDIAATSLSLAGIKQPGHMQGQVFLGPQAKKRKYIFAARDRCDETVDRIRCVRTKRYKYIRNFFPERPYTQFNAYKTKQYPVLTLMKVLQKRGELTKAQANFMAARRAQEELYDLKKDPYETHNLASEPAYHRILKELAGELDRWMLETADMGRIAEDKEVTEYWKREAAARYKRDMKIKGLLAESSPEEHLQWWEEQFFNRRAGEIE